MNEHTVEAMTVAALRDLDPAPATALTRAERERADTTLARILATPGHDRPAAEPERPRRRRSRLLGAVGLVCAAGAALPALLGGGSAFASWTPTPEPLSGVAAAEAATTCLAVTAGPHQGERVVIAERRGGWTYVLLAGPRTERHCLMPAGLIGHEFPAEHTKEGFLGSHDPDPGEHPTPARGRIVVTTTGAGSVPTDGLWGFRDDEEWVSWIEGRVGSDVTAVTVHAPTGVDVQASVAKGRFAAWWPSAVPSSEDLDVMGAPTYTVTLADGSTRQLTG